MELPGRDPAVEGRTGARPRQRRGAEACLGRDWPGPAARRAARPLPAGGALPGGARQRQHRQGPDRAGRRGLVHRFGGGRARCRLAGHRQAEMGGLNASIVLPDTDPEPAAKMVAWAAMAYAGQKCTATSRVIVVGDPAPFRDALVAACEALKVGDPEAQDTLVGPLIGEQPRDQVVAVAEEAAGRGGRILSGGFAPELDGWFAAPTLVDHLQPHDHLAQTEIFGPFCVLLEAADADEAVRIANDTSYGLVTSVFTGDLDRALRLASRLDTGMIRVNAPTSGVDFHAPFGGEKDSSFGPREQGKAAREFYTSTRTITIAPLAGGG